jgi:hypothetical protein
MAKNVALEKEAMICKEPSPVLSYPVGGREASIVYFETPSIRGNFHHAGKKQHFLKPFRLVFSN